MIRNPHRSPAAAFAGWLMELAWQTSLRITSGKE
jgi:hypothetical protein